MAEETIEKRVLRIVRKVLELGEEPIDTEATFESLGADSDKITELISEFNKGASVPISEEELTAATKVIDVIGFFE